MCIRDRFADYLFAHNVPRVLDEVVNDVMQDMPDNPWAALVRPIYSSLFAVVAL